LAHKKALHHLLFNSVYKRQISETRNKPKSGKQTPCMRRMRDREPEQQQAYVPADTSFLFLKFNTSNEQVISYGSYRHKGFKRTDSQ